MQRKANRPASAEASKQGKRSGAQARKKVVIVRQLPDYSLSDQVSTAEAIASDLDATKGNLQPAAQTTVGEDESHGRVHDVKIDGGSVVESKGSEFSPGKDPNLSVANYVSQIGQNWQRGVDAFMTIARLCAEASAQLTIAEREELLKQLPFGDSAFSKFVQIGNDHRLNSPEVRRLLPPHYTITYSVTLLTDHELRDAVAEKVIHPDMHRGDLQRWRNSHRELPTKGGFAPSQDEAASDSVVTSLPTVPANDEAAVGISSPSDAPVQPDVPDNLDITPLLERREPEKAFAALNAAWFNAPSVVRSRFVAEVLGITGDFHDRPQGQHN